MLRTERRRLESVLKQESHNGGGCRGFGLEKNATFENRLFFKSGKKMGSSKSFYIV